MFRSTVITCEISIIVLQFSTYLIFHIVNLIIVYTSWKNKERTDQYKVEEKAFINGKQAEKSFQLTALTPHRYRNNKFQ